MLQAAVTGISSALFVVASQSSILYVVRVTFHEDDTGSWLAILRQLLVECVPWTCNPSFSAALSSLPSIPMHHGSIKLSKFGACTDQHTLVTHFALTRKLFDIVKARGHPLPVAEHILPSQIAQWNLMKGMTVTDTFSRVMKNCKADFKRLHPHSFFIIRLLNAAMYNAHLLRRAFAIEPRLDQFTSLQQLRHALKNEGSFKDSLTMIVSSFKVLHPLLRAPSPPHASAATATSANTATAALHLRGTPSLPADLTLARNDRKRRFLNSPHGLLRRLVVGHGPTVATSPRHCVICNSFTQQYCKSCSDPGRGIYFFICTAPHLNTSAICFNLFHTVRTIKPMVAQKKARRSVGDP